MDKPKVIVQVVGGVAYIYDKPNGVEVEIWDYDSAQDLDRNDPRVSIDSEGDAYVQG